MRPTSFISTGSRLLDVAIGCPGIPQGRITLVIGNEEGSKTTLCTHIMSQCQKIGGEIHYYDAEGTYDEERAKRIGLDVDKVEFYDPLGAEEGFSIIRGIAAKVSKKPRLLVWDTYSATSLQVERGDAKKAKKGEEPSVTDAVAGHARLVSWALRGIAGQARRNNLTLVVVEQLKTSIQSWGWGEAIDYLARRPWTFHAMLGIMCKRIKRLEKNKVPYGSRSRFQVFRNKMNPPFKTCELDTWFDDGFHEPMANILEGYLEAAVAGGLVEQKGAWFRYGEQHFKRSQWPDFLSKQPELASKLGITDLANDVESEEESADAEEQVATEASSAISEASPTSD